MPKRIIFDVDDELYAQINELSKKFSQGVPKSKQEWLQTDEGKQFWKYHRLKRHLHPSVFEREINEAYRKATGGSKMGRPRSAEHRLALLKESIELFAKLNA